MRERTERIVRCVCVCQCGCCYMCVTAVWGRSLGEGLKVEISSECRGFLSQGRLCFLFNLSRFSDESRFRILSYSRQKKKSEGSYMPCDAIFPSAIVKKHRDQLRTKRKMEYKGKKEK